MSGQSSRKRKSPEKGEGNVLASMWKAKDNNNKAAAAEEKASQLAVAAAAAAVVAADARRVADAASNNASSSGANNDRDNPQEILERILGDMSSDVEISESFLGDVAFDDVTQLVIKKLIDDLWATVGFNLKKQPTQFFYQTPAWLEGKEKAHLGVKKTRSHEIRTGVFRRVEKEEESGSSFIV